MIDRDTVFIFYLYSKNLSKQGIVLDVLSPNEWYLKIFCWVTKASLLFQQYSFPSLLNYICLIRMWIYGSFSNPIPRSARSYILFYRIFYDQKFSFLWSMELKYWLRWYSVLFNEKKKIGEKLDQRSLSKINKSSKRFTFKNSSSSGETADA